MIHLMTSFFEITLWIDMPEVVHKLQRVFSVMYPHCKLLLLDTFILLKRSNLLFGMEREQDQ